MATQDVLKVTAWTSAMSDTLSVDKESSNGHN